MRGVLLVLGSTIALACAVRPTTMPTAAVVEASQTEPLSALGMSCSEPFALLQDCSDLWGPQRHVEIRGARMKIASSTDGRIVLLTSQYPILAQISGQKEDLTNTAYHAVRAELDREGAQVLAVTAVGSASDLFGYIIEADRDVYSRLKRFSLK